MKLETAIELIREASGIQAVYVMSDGDLERQGVSKQHHDDCLRIARRILLENMYDYQERQAKEGQVEYDGVENV